VWVLTQSRSNGMSICLHTLAVGYVGPFSFGPGCSGRHVVKHRQTSDIQVDGISALVHYPRRPVLLGAVLVLTRKLRRQFISCSGEVTLSSTFAESRAISFVLAESQAMT
jgi:hypothetical protein